MSGAPLYRLSLLAQRDVDQITDYLLAEAGATIAERVLTRLYDLFEMLAREPGASHRRDDLFGELEIRCWPVYSYLILYRERTPLEIVRVWSARQDPEALRQALDEDNQG